MENMQTSVFDDAQHYQQPAGTGLRFVNYLVDMLVFYAVLFGSFFLLGIAIGAAGGLDSFASFMNSTVGKLCTYLIVFVMLVLVYTLIEGATKGRSLGKLITGTVALREDGAPISWKDAFMRSLCRCIPFEAFSAFGGYPWHDKMTHTIVVKKSIR